MSFQECMEGIKKWMFRIMIAAGLLYGAYLLIVSWLYPEWATPIALRNFLILVVGAFALVFVVCVIWFIIWFLCIVINPARNIQDAFSRDTNEDSKPGVVWGFFIAIIIIGLCAVIYCLIRGLMTDFSFISEFLSDFLDSFTKLFE